MPRSRMPPTQQRLEPGDRPVVQTDHRLIEHLELSASHRLPQIQLQQAPRLHLRIHFGVEQPADAATVRLRAIQGEVGAAQQLVRIHAVLRREGNADTGADHDPMAGDIERRLDQFDQAGGEAVASAGFSMRDCTMANSSPPRRATVSVSRNCPASRSDTARSNSSPTG